MGPHVCDICDKSFARTGDFKRHSLIHKRIKPHVCNVCNKTFVQIGHLNTHILIHKNKKPHVCDVCNKSFTRKDQLNDHSLIHNGIKDHECSVCNKKFTLKAHLKLHFLIHKDIKPHVCDVCDKGFARKENLKRHKTNHKRITVLSSSTNDTKKLEFISVDDICFDSESIVTPEMEKNLSCDKATQEKEKDSQLYEDKDPSSSKNDNECLKDIEKDDACFNTISIVNLIKERNVSFDDDAQEKELDLNIEEDKVGVRFNLSHEDKLDDNSNAYPDEEVTVKEEPHVSLDEEISAIPKGKKNHVCIEEDKVRTRFNLSHEDKLHDNLNAYPDEEVTVKEEPYVSFDEEISAIPKEKKDHVCKFCEKRFAYKTHLTRHSLIHEGVKPHVCNVCDKSFTQKCNLTKHMLFCKGIKNHVCDICGKNFTLKIHLKTHSLTHKGIKPFACDFCDTSFTRKADLKKHTIIHEEIKLHVCDVCNMSFTHKRNLKRHSLIHEKIKPHACKLCDKSFAQKGNWKKHMLIHERKSHTSSRTNDIESMKGIVEDVEPTFSFEQVWVKEEPSFDDQVKEEPS